MDASQAGSRDALATLPAEVAAKLVRLEQLETQFAHAVDQAKLAALKEFAYGAGHEINNPLANISARAQTLLKDERDPERRRKLAAINTQAFRAHEMIADLMLFARPPQLNLQRVDLPEFVDRQLEQLAVEARNHRTQIVRVGTVAQPLLADATQLGIALSALCLNALEAIGVGGHIEVELRETPFAVEICVRDDGPGISDEIRPRIFDPFFSGREAGRGLGFGLPKAWRIITAHGGTLEALDSSAGGAVLKICLVRSG